MTPKEEKAVLSREQIEALRALFLGPADCEPTTDDPKLIRLIHALCDLALSALSRHALGWVSVEEELERAIKKFPTWPTDPLHAVAVVGEEFGELTKAVLEFTYEPHKTSREEVVKEALQTAAMALRFVASLDRYEFKLGHQHSQPAPGAEAKP